jgi:hypothetical protein
MAFPQNTIIVGLCLAL